MSNRIDKILSLVLVCAAVAIAAAFVKREFGSPETSALQATRAPTEVSYVAEWRDILKYGVLDGPADAPIVIIEFADMECPFCKRWHEEVLPELQREYEKQLTFAYVHYPIRGHRFAKPAARAAHCAAEEQRFHAFLQVVYNKQDSLGLKPWTGYATEAGVRDTTSFKRCVTSTTPVVAVDSGTAVGDRIGVTGTPTILVNGWRFPSPPTAESISEAISALRSGARPFANKGR